MTARRDMAIFFPTGFPLASFNPVWNDELLCREEAGSLTAAGEGQRHKVRYRYPKRYGGFQVCYRHPKRCGGFLSAHLGAASCTLFY